MLHPNLSMVQTHRMHQVSIPFQDQQFGEKSFTALLPHLTGTASPKSEIGQDMSIGRKSDSNRFEPNRLSRRTNDVAYRSDWRVPRLVK